MCNHLRAVLAGLDPAAAAAAAALATAAAADGESSRAHAARRAISGGSIWPNEVTPPTPPPGMHAAGGVAYRKPESIVGVAAPEPCAER